jgi:hypothetical protein
MPAIKDAIEALGIPHVEVETIMVNGTSVGFYHPLGPEDKVEVYPFTQLPAHPQHFILDVHLGKLARLLRLLGFDTLYQNDFTDKFIAETAENQDRIVLTRDVGLLKNKIIKWGYWLRSQDPFLQLQEVIQRFRLKKRMHPFSRCLACNGIIKPVNKNEILYLLPPNTRNFFDEFYQCQSCKRIYWKGSHYQRMLTTIKHCSE